jgi:hypothetical protein
MRTLVTRVSRALCLLGAAVLALSPTSTAGTANGTRIVLWTCNGGANQKWQLH